MRCSDHNVEPSSNISGSRIVGTTSTHKLQVLSKYRKPARPHRINGAAHSHVLDERFIIADASPIRCLTSIASAQLVPCCRVSLRRCNESRKLPPRASQSTQNASCKQPNSAPMTA
jgi:hypothetical protein